MLARMMGGRIPGAPMKKKESKEEIKIEVDKENQDDIIMNKPMYNKNYIKRKPKKVIFIDGVINELSEEDEDEDEENSEVSNENNENEKNEINENNENNEINENETNK